ncbi:MAG: sodium:calcium antiporter [Acidobacteria bacterium]|nr:sodium:calcium antiporter [Acidobacteriota bacterium]MCW5971006.1 sodium:calcium antiporter [Blastocatellales bacterium]
MFVWLQFIACTAVILLAGTQLSKYGDVIAEKSGLGRTFIGVVLMASVTSLPELITGVSSVTLFDLPNIAAGDVLGSCMFNILIIALLDFRIGHEPISARAHQGQVLTAACGVMLLGLVSIALLAGANIPSIGWVSLASVGFLLVYLVSMRLVFLYEKKRISEYIEDRIEESQYGDISKRRAYSMYAVNAAVVIAAATWLPHLGEQIAEMTGLGKTFVGSIFIALATSLPELVVSFASLRIGAVDMVLGNLFGSNLFNIGILAIDDILYTKGSLLLAVSGSHLVSASAAIAMTGIAIIGLTYRTGRKMLVFAWDSTAILVVYGLATWILYALR